MTRPSPFAELERLITGSLERLGNASLDLDPLSRARLVALEGSSVRFDLILPGAAEARRLTLTIREGRLVITAGGTERPNAIVRGTPADLLAWLVLSSGPGRQGSLTFEGDESVLRELAELARRYRPDVEKPLAGVAGERAARDVMEALQLGAQTFGAALRALGEIVTDGARSSARAGFVASRDLPPLQDGIDALSLRIDRLNARVALVEERRGSATGGAGS